MPLTTSLAALLLLSAQGTPKAIAKDIMLGRRCLLVAVPSISKELKLTESQLKKYIDIFDGTLKIDGERVTLTPNADTDLDAMEKETLALLDAGQQERLTQIWIQRSGPLAITDDEISKKLELSAVQKNEVDALLVEGAKKVQEVFASERDADTPKKAQELRNETARKVLRVLTEQQRRDFDAMRGKPFRPSNA